jgi:trehalose 6-phosphate phosphatase
MLAFDLDGTLSPIVVRPADAEVPFSTALRLEALETVWPIAVITGRSVADAQKRLNFSPRYLIGNHGAESSNTQLGGHLYRLLDPCRKHLQICSLAIQNRKIEVEDKGLSLAMHYREIISGTETRAWLNELVAPLSPYMHISHGHQVMNIMPIGAPDKGDALLEAMNHCGAISALVLGDDVNDEPAFAKAPAGSVSVRIGPLSMSTQARFRLSSQTQVDRLLSILLSIKRHSKKVAGLRETFSLRN